MSALILLFYHAYILIQLSRNLSKLIPFLLILTQRLTCTRWRKLEHENNKWISEASVVFADIFISIFIGKDLPIDVRSDPYLWTGASGREWEIEITTKLSFHYIVTRLTSHKWGEHLRNFGMSSVCHIKMSQYQTRKPLRHLADSYSSHDKLWGNPGADLKDAGGVLYPTWSVNASGLLPQEPSRSLRMCMGGWTSRPICLTYYYCTLEDLLWKKDEWITLVYC